MQTFDGNEDFKFFRGIGLTVIFFLVTPVIIATTLFSLFQISKMEPVRTDTADVQPNLLQNPQSGLRVYASLPMSLPEITGSPETADARVEIIRQYLKAYYSPLEPYAANIVQEADKNMLDYRLLTAIAQQESNLCKAIPPGSYNCWGWGIHSKGTLGFSSFEEGISIVSEGIKENYIDKGYTTINDIMSKYTPSSEGSWANGVSKFMTEMEQPF
jgi:hypothetical protein